MWMSGTSRKRVSFGLLLLFHLLHHHPSCWIAAEAFAEKRLLLKRNDQKFANPLRPSEREETPPPVRKKRVEKFLLLPSSESVFNPPFVLWSSGRFHEGPEAEFAGCSSWFLLLGAASASAQ